MSKCYFVFWGEVVVGLALFFWTLNAPTNPVIAATSNSAPGKGALQILTLESGVFDCDGENHYVERAQPMRIRKVFVWYGMDLGGKADLLGVVIKQHQRDGQIVSDYVVKGGWDHYADPAGISNQTLDVNFAPDWIAIEPDKGDTLRLYYQCFGFSEPQPHAKVIAVVYYLPLLKSGVR